MATQDDPEADGVVVAVSFGRGGAQLDGDTNMPLERDRIRVEDAALRRQACPAK